MLETFGWTGGFVFDSGHMSVLATEQHEWNVLDAFTEPGAVFGFVLDGENAVLRHNHRSHSLVLGSYFVINVGIGNVSLTNPGGKILLIYQRRANFPFMVGGPIEPFGRLRYIDGCTDSLLIPPWRLGEPCLNYLHIPARVEQTMHTHPSDRFGVVVSGRGQCVTPDGVTELERGLVWRIPADALHRFRTDGESLRIVAWHPTSEWGPSDEGHPMVRSTLIGGVSAADIPEIRTR